MAGMRFANLHVCRPRMVGGFMAFLRFIVLGFWLSTSVYVWAFDFSSQQFQSVITGRELSQKDVIFRSLLGSTGKDLDWPSFPRTWHEENMTETVTSNTAVGLSMSGAGGGVALDYKWGLKTSLVIIASNRAKDVVMDKNGVTVQPVDESSQFELFRWDEATNRPLPLITKDRPMVAFCAFEMSLTSAESVRGGLQFLGSGQTVENAKIRTVSHTMFSRFFQLDGTLSPKQLLDHVCADFREAVKSYAQRDFSRTVLEMYAYTPVENQCLPDPASDGSDGDVSCMDWHKEHFDSVMRSLTIPRCVLTSRGTHHCEVRAREGGHCPMYWDARSRQALRTSQLTPKKYYPRATNNPLEFPCDTTQGMSCQMTEQPVIFLNVPIWSGEARCVKARGV